MDDRIHQILLSNDSETDWEFPQGFDWRSSWEAVRKFKTDAEAVLGQPLQIDDHVQDASFFTELFVFEEGAQRPDGVTTMAFKIAIRFSSFGRMAAVHTNSSRSELDKYPVDRLAALLEAHGFVHIPAAALAEQYDGCNTERLGPDFTWWLRFFDYL